MDIVRNGKGIQEDVPIAVSDLFIGIHENKKSKAENNHDDCGTVSAPGDGGKHKAHVSEKEHREKQLKSHLENVHRI